MTQAQKPVLDFIRKFRRKHGYSPSYDEMGAALGMSKSAVYCHVTRLVERGYLRREGPVGARRALVPVDARAVQ